MYIGTYGTYLFDTPNGRLGTEYYADAGVSPRDNQQYYYVGFTGTRLQMGDVTTVSRQQDIRNKTLATVIGLQYFNVFFESNIVIEEQTTEQTIINLRTRQNEPYPTRG